LEDVPMPKKLLSPKGSSVQSENDSSEDLPIGKQRMPLGYSYDTEAQAQAKHMVTLAYTGLPAAPRQWQMSECTLVVRCLPKCVQSELLQIWSSHEYLFNFLFLPFCEKRRRSVSYCFINFIHYEAAVAFRNKWSDMLLPLHSSRAKADNVRTICMDVAQLQGFIPNVMNAGEQITNSRLKEKHPPAVFDLFGNPRSFFDTLARVSSKAQAQGEQCVLWSL